MSVRSSILQVHWTVPPTTGGVESHIVDLSRWLAHKGCRVTLLTGEEQPISDASYEVLTSPFLNLDRIKTSKSSFPEEEMTALQSMISEITVARNISIIHGHNLHHFSPAPALVIERIRRQSAIAVHHTYHETWPNLLSDSPVYRSWDGNYAVSRFVQVQCELALGFSPELLPLGVDVSVFSPQSLCLAEASLPVILHPARLLPWKGAHVSVQMMRMLLDRGYEAQLILTDTQRIADWNQELNEYRCEVYGLVSRLGLKKNVRFVSVKYADMPSLYDEADIVVYPTVGQEPYGLVPLEAMSCARPVVVSRSGGMAETTLEGVTGYIVEPGNVAAVTNAVMKLLRAPKRAQKMGAAGRRHVHQKYNSKNYVDVLLKRYFSARVRP